MKWKEDPKTYAILIMSHTQVNRVYKYFKQRSIQRTNTVVSLHEGNNKVIVTQVIITCHIKLEDVRTNPQVYDFH